MSKSSVSRSLKAFYILFIWVGPWLYAQQVQEPWYKSAIIYSLEIGTFKDSDGDGIGDFKGLIQKLGYLDSLGVNTLWLAPFQPSPGQDDGYDVADYYSINPKYGSASDFHALIEAAKAKHMRIITDIVLNHTSVTHPWFEQARRDSLSKYHSWYVWAKNRPKDADKGMVFPGVQKETWTYDSLAHKYYFHRFYNFQPDLNYTNKEVQLEAHKVLQYWLRLGVDGYRLDAVPFIVDIPETSSENPDRMLQLIPEFRKAVKEVKNDALLLGEANLAPKENKDYFGKDNNGMQMMFNFYANQYLFYALASTQLKLFKRALKDTKEKPELAQWAYFLRNHDEIDLERLGDRRRKKVYERFGPEPYMQLYDRGIRRRLAPMLHNDAQLRMVYSLLFSLPGTPVIRYGEEIGMGDDLSLQERLSVRTPMQWSAGHQAGFSSADKTFRKVISDSIYGYKNLNVAQQLSDSMSLLSFIRKTIKIRRECPEIGAGPFEVLKTSNKNVLAIYYQGEGKALLALHNFDDAPHTFTIRHHLEGKTPQPLLSSNDVRNLSAHPQKFVLPAYGFVWYRLK